MKKLFALLSLSAFLAISVHAQTPQTSSPAKKENTTEVKANADSPAASCCKKTNASCCKNTKAAKACTAEQKAACAKAGTSAKECNHAKAEASEVKETKEVKEIKSGSN